MTTTEQASLANLLPTPLLRGTAAIMVTSVPGIFVFLESQLPRMGFPLTSLETHLISVVGATLVSLLFALLLAAEACWLLYKTREKRVITTWSQRHPIMSWSWLAANAERKHALAVGLFALCMIGAGACVALLLPIANPS